VSDFVLLILYLFLYIYYGGGDVGDLVSPGMFEDYLTTLNTVRAYSGSSEGYVYEFAINLQTLNYLQTINLLDEAKLRVTLEFMQTSTSILVLADAVVRRLLLTFVRILF